MNSQTAAEAAGGTPRQRSDPASGEQSEKAGSGPQAGLPAALGAPLWETEAELDRAYELLDENEGAHDPEAEALVVSALEAAIDKRDRVVGFLRTVRAYEDHLDAEVERLRAKAERARSIRKRLLAYVGAVMAGLGVRELRGKTSGFRIVKNPPRVAIDDFERIPARFFREKTIREPKLDEIRTALKAGELIPGVHLEQGERVDLR